VVTEVTDDAFHVLVKAKLTAGEVLEFISPLARETVLLRLYDFEVAKDRSRTDVVHGSTQTVIRLPFSLFDHENIDVLKARFPAYTVLRKERALTEEQWNRIRFDKLTQALEVSGKDNPKAYTRRRDALAESIAQDSNEKRFKTNRIGTEGCCGKGCNGCLIFWQDPQYELARTALQKRKQGEMLSRSEATELRLPAG